MASDAMTPQRRVETVASQPGSQLGERLRRLRKQAGWTLQELSRYSGVSLSTLSKIENSQVAPTFDTLVKAARGLGIGFEALLAEPVPTEPPPVISRRAAGRLMVTRAGAAVAFSTPMYDYAVHANGLRRKYMTPLIMEVKASTADDVVNWSSHDGEEFILVLSGTIELHTEFYDPVRLETGDSAYIDSGMAHMFLSIGQDHAHMASICYSDAIDGPSLMANVPEAADQSADKPTDHNRSTERMGSA
jgi:transcriptional regulator with XRE-family HTH domain/quercetin dioxygenase-like cupin family protein